MIRFCWPKRLHWLLAISAAVFILDRLSKNYVSRHVAIGDSIPIVPHVLFLSHWTNEGAAFSLFANTASPHTVRWALIIFSLVASLVVLWFLARLSCSITRTTVALALILAGALGNLHDRIAYGSVVDFIEVHIFRYHWPDFNIADSAVVTGACLLLLDSFLQKESKPSDNSAGSQT